MIWNPLASEREHANPQSELGGTADYWDLSNTEWMGEMPRLEAVFVSEIISKIQEGGHEWAFSSIDLNATEGSYSITNWESYIRADESTLDSIWPDDFIFNLDRRLRVLARFGDPLAMTTLAVNAILRLRDDMSEEERAALSNESIRWYLRARSVLEIQETQTSEMSAWIDYVRGSITWMFDMLEKFGVLTPDVLAFDTRGLAGQGWLAPVCRAHGHIEHFVDDGQLFCLFLNMDPTKIAVSIDTPEGLKDYDVCVEILSDSFLWDLDDTALDNLSDFRHYILERWDVDWDVSVGQANGQLFFEDLLMRFPELDAEDELSSESRSRIRGEYEDGLEISHQATFDFLVTAQSAEEAYFFVKRFAHKVFFHSSHSADDLAIDEVRVLLVDGMKFDSGVAE